MAHHEQDLPCPETAAVRVVLLVGLGPNWGLIPLGLAAQEDGLRGRTQLQGGHELGLELTRH